MHSRWKGKSDTSWYVHSEARQSKPFSVDAQSFRELSGTGETMNVDTGDLFLYCSQSGSCTHGWSLNASLRRVRIASRDLLTIGQTLLLMQAYRLVIPWVVRSFFDLFHTGFSPRRDTGDEQNARIQRLIGWLIWLTDWLILGVQRLVNREGHIRRNTSSNHEQIKSAWVCSRYTSVYSWKNWQKWS